MSADTVSSGLVRTTEFIFPAQTNHYGTLFAGNGLALMARVAVIAATRKARQDAVMAAVEKASFDSPVRIGELLELTAEVSRVGRTSMTVHVVGIAETPATGLRRQAMTGQFEMVAVDAEGRPSPISGTAIPA